MSEQILRSGDGRVSFGELFYDLVFVFAITQISHFLLSHFTLTGALQTGFLFLAVWWIWIYSTWVLNRLNPESLGVRLLLFAMMIGGLFMSMALPQAFAERGAVFGIAFAVVQVGRSVFILVHSGDLPNVQRTYRRITSWVALAGVFWVWGGLADPSDRVLLWGLALGIELIAPILRYPVPGLGRDTTTDWSINGGHMAERCGLFVIICLGETLLVSGATFAGMVWDAPGVAAFGSAVLGAIAMWWVYFHVGHKRGTHLIEHSANPGALGRLAFTYLHIPIIAGIVLGAVGSELTIAHPMYPATWGQSLVIVGGTLVFLAGNGLFKRVSAPRFPLSHLVGMALCLGVFAATPWLTLLLLNSVTVIILVVVAVWEDRSLNRT